MDWKLLLAEEHITVKEALKKMDVGGQKILLIVNNHHALLGVITDGDLRRHIIATGTLDGAIKEIYNQNPLYLTQNCYTIEEAKGIMREKKIEVLPIVDHKKEVVGVLIWTDIYGGKTPLSETTISVPVVIMAGGQGKRLDPFTKVLPKPLIPFKDRPILEVIINRFRHYGVSNFYITLNYKGEMVKTYFESIEKDYRIDYIWENEFLGTAGSIKLLPPDISDIFIVSNCDIIVDADYADLLEFHRKKNNALTVVGSMQSYRIPYGIMQFGSEGKIENIREKPEIDFTVNTGLYVFSKEVIDCIPEGKPFNMTDLIEVLLKKNASVGVYPVSQKAYVDIGHWKEYGAHTEGYSL
jgi:dTDP-glucose pyrophosphorylase